MKKYTLILAAVLMSALLPFSCSGSDDDQPTPPTPSSDIYPHNVFSHGLPKSVDGFALSTNSAGLVTLIAGDSEGYSKWVSFDYAKGTSGSYDVKIVQAQPKDEDQTTTWYCKLNSQGFIAHAEDYTIDTGTGQNKHQTWDFTYDADGHMTSVKRTQSNESATVRLTWQDGNVTRIDFPDKASATVAYSSSTVPGYANEGNIMLYDQWFDMEVDDHSGMAYYAGLLGKSTKNLPLSMQETDGSDRIDYAFSWLFNADNLPTRMKVSETNNGHASESTVIITW